MTDPRLTRFEIVKEGLRRDEIEIVTYESQFQGVNSKAERRVVRNIALLFLLSGWAASPSSASTSGGRGTSSWATPRATTTRRCSASRWRRRCSALGFAILAWAKKLLPHEVSIQKRHDGASPTDEQLITGQTMLFVADELAQGVQRRPLLKGAIAIGMAPLGLAAAAPLIGGLIENPHKGSPPMMFSTGFNPANNGGKLVRLSREDGTPIRPDDVSTGGQMTVFPGIPGGATNE